MTETTQPVFKNAAYTQEYIDIANSLDGDVPGRRAARAYMDASTAIVHHQVVSTSFVPKLYDAASRQVMRDVVETTHRILCKVMQHYLDDAEYRKVFDYDPRLAELILVPRRLRRAAAVRPLRHLPRREHWRRGVLRVQRRRQLGHEREPRNHALRGANGHVQGIRQASPR
ncbi:MAG: hypothetical protein V8T51_05655 [Senegalimassilia faecalis]